MFKSLLIELADLLSCALSAAGIYAIITSRPDTWIAVFLIACSIMIRGIVRPYKNNPEY
ncbi:hypothetical protein [Sulfuricurvum sp.]|uniref:hypothetical protein n=1 Tax=Sulfuricurvum sp. TaxID=2025608 RepID=UPI00260B0238|nr:hypothetical protein [Sulfuricurvum sp.]MDD3595579.1 hypothetical protein [Sulfuricurvum sp.]